MQSEAMGRSGANDARRRRCSGGTPPRRYAAGGTPTRLRGTKRWGGGTSRLRGRAAQMTDAAALDAEFGMQTPEFASRRTLVWRRFLRRPSAVASLIVL